MMSPAMTPTQMRGVAEELRRRIAGRREEFPALCRYIVELEEEADRLTPPDLATQSQRGQPYSPRRPVMMRAEPMR